jgi:hypothetical protein
VEESGRGGVGARASRGKNNDNKGTFMLSYY